MLAHQARRGSLSRVPREAGRPLTGYQMEISMKAVRIGMLAIVAALSGFPQSQSPEKNHPAASSDREKLIGEWRLVSIASPGPDAKTMSLTHPTGMLIYTRDGHVSVQLMYPRLGAALSNEYVL